MLMAQMIEPLAVCFNLSLLASPLSILRFVSSSMRFRSKNCHLPAFLASRSLHIDLDNGLQHRPDWVAVLGHHRRQGVAVQVGERASVSSA